MMNYAGFCGTAQTYAGQRRRMEYEAELRVPILAYAKLCEAKFNSALCRALQAYAGPSYVGLHKTMHTNAELWDLESYVVLLKHLRANAKYENYSELFGAFQDHFH